MSIVFKSTHVVDGIAHLLQQFKEKPNIESVLAVFLDENQQLENAIEGVLNGYNIDLAVGEQLDVLGRLVSQPRGSLTDDNYRGYIKAKIKINRSSGTLEEIYEIIRLVEGQADDSKLYTSEIPPAAMLITIAEPLVVVDGQSMFDIIESVRSAAVSLTLFYTLPGHTPFEFSESEVTAWGAGTFLGSVTS